MAKTAYTIRRLRVVLRRATRYWPWAASASIHVIVLALLSAVAFISIDRAEQRPEIVPEARLGRIDPNPPLFAPSRRDYQPMQRQFTPEHVEQALARRNTLETDEWDIEMITAPAASSDDPAAPGLDHTSPAAPATRFFNAGGNAYSVVYVVDISPSMMPFFRPLKAELKRCLDDLRPMQKFHVLFFSSGQPVEGPGRGLVWASDRNKTAYADFIDTVQTDIRTDPRWAVRRALELNADLVYLLTDGVFDMRLADEIIDWGRARKIKINTIAYVNEQGSIVLRKIAESTGGVYRFVSEGSLQWD